MTELPEVFQASKEEKMGSFDPLPNGWYIARVKKSDIKSAKANAANKYISLQWGITEDAEGNAQKRVVFSNLNIINANPIAVEIARKELASICEAMDIEDLEDTDELLDIEIGVLLGTRAATANYPAQNEIKEYRKLPLPTGDSAGYSADDESMPWS